MMDVLASTVGRHGAVGTSLHADIMNIPCTRPSDIADETAEMAYSMGHRDARHSAAELALSAI